MFFGFPKLISHGHIDGGFDYIVLERLGYNLK
jgi:hypothetical protein